MLLKNFICKNAIPIRFLSVSSDIPINEPVYAYLKGSKEEIKLRQAIKNLESQTIDVPLIINGKEYRTNDVKYQYIPYNKEQKIAKFYYATPDLLNKAIKASLNALEEWDNTSYDNRAQIFLKAAEMVSNQERMNLMAATMLGQGKTIVQAEIDTACELADFLRFNVYFGKNIDKYCPISPPNTKNSYRYRGLEGFVAAISPFNFTAIGGNLCSAPALMGNVVLWKPSDSAILSNYLCYKVLEKCGLPPGIINFVPCDGPTFSQVITNNPALAGINFTGSVPTFRNIWLAISQNLASIENWPRMVGECGGKNYHLIHESACATEKDLNHVIYSTIRGAFEYSGQKCSACSILYVPKNVWNEGKMKQTIAQIVENELKIGDATDHTSFSSAVIDKRAFDKITAYIKHAKASPDYKLIAGGTYDESKGYFIRPTIFETTNPKGKLISEEIFGPILTVFPYDNNEFDQILNLIRESIYGLTGAIFIKDRNLIEQTARKLRRVNGNFYINDKCTGAVVNQQPFGGARASGTNDKAGGPHYLLRWTSPQSIKENFSKLSDWKYPYMA